MQARLWLTLAVFFEILSWAGFRIATDILATECTEDSE